MWSTCRKVTAVLGLFVLMTQATFADSLRISQVVQTVRPTEGLVDLRINTVAQEPGSADTRGTVSGQNDKTKNENQIITPTPSLLGLEIKPQQPQVGVEVVGDAIVEGTVCDCGEILIPGGLPKWPLIFLAAIPLFFVRDCEDCDTIITPTCLTCDSIVIPTPSPTPPNSTTPEPATLFLFGSGLLAFGAGFRRRYSRSKQSSQKKDEVE
jgi:hypothetical protein